jgi:hypothetical protein
MFYNLHDQSGPGWTLHHAECIERMRAMSPDTVDAIVTDPPYHLTSIKARYGTNETRARNRSDAMARLAGGFMGKAWDGGNVAFRVETWQAAYRVLKPGGYIMAFASSRGYHRMAVAIEDAGFITHPMIGWVFGSGFPKATDASRMIDQALGAKGGRGAVKPGRENYVGKDNRRSMRETGTLAQDGGFSRPWMNDPESVQDGHYEYAPVTPEAEQWQGWYYGGQARKPALEPIYVGQKPFSERNGALNILRWGVGAVNIDGCRAGETGATTKSKDVATRETLGIYGNGLNGGKIVPLELGRWPANLMHDGSPEVLALFPAAPGQLAASRTNGTKDRNVYGHMAREDVAHQPRNDTGSAARFFECYPPVVTYCPKANARDRLGSRHPTVKPMALMRSFVRHVCPPGGIVLDPFAGTGTTLRAAVLENRRAIGIEADAASVVDTVWRMRHAQPE